MSAADEAALPVEASPPAAEPVSAPPPVTPWVVKDEAADLAVVETQPRPLAEVEIGGPEIDVDQPPVTIRSVDTVSAIDLVMGPDDPTDGGTAADARPAGA